MESMIAKMVLFLLLLAVSLRSCGASFGYEPVTLEECGDKESNFTSFNSSNCDSRRGCVAFIGERLRLEFSAKNNNQYAVDVVVLVTIESLDRSHTQYFRASCQDYYINFPCTAKPNEEITGYMQIPLDKEYKEGAATFTVHAYSLACGRGRVYMKDM
uniref:17.7 kDa putative secretory protein n=1 Tax=Argas monolakensis TaxID=34602 RepID=Q09JQ9_ARGMO|nr:17.7 kDa putative secretory protein [Argas monolakensis]